jgi:hypothetical protein
MFAPVQTDHCFCDFAFSLSNQVSENVSGFIDSYFDLTKAGVVKFLCDWRDSVYHLFNCLP